MIELNALIYLDPGCQISQTEAAEFRRRCMTKQSAYSVGNCVNNLLLLVSGDAPVEDCFHASARTSLICHTDLWNELELRRQFGISQDEATAALVVALYEAQGETFVLNLQGSFSVILYDHQNHVLRAFTDPFGVRPLAYTQSNRKLAVATDLRRLIRTASVTPAIDPYVILEFLQYSCIPAPHTIYKNMHRLEPGHQLISKPAAHSLPYWDMNFKEDSSHRGSENEWASLTEAEIRKAVARSSVLAKPDMRLGCFLSGGTDSSSVTGLLGKLTGSPPCSFSIGFDDHRYNEIEYARIAAGYHRSDHSEYFVTPKNILELMPQVCATYDEPFGNSSVIPTYFCARLGKDHGMTHMLAGDGGDELFGGNERYVSDRIFQRYQSIPKWARKALLEPAVSVAASTMGNVKLFDRASRYVRRANIPLPDRIFSYGLLSSFPREQLFHPDFLARCNGQDSLQTARRHYLSAPAQTRLNRWLYLDLKMIIGDNDLRKVTRMSDLAGVTVRYPLLDRELAEFTGTIPSRLKVKGNQLRYIFKKAMKQVLPAEIIKKKKHGFGLPYCVWLGEYKPLKEFTFDTLGSPRCRQRAYFRKDMLEWLWNGYAKDDRTYYGDVIWLFVMLELWHRQQWDAV